MSEQYEYYHARVMNKVNATNLKSFRIFALFDRYDVDLVFDKEVNIFIGENGLGKTTILNCLYFVLEKKFAQLEKIPFEAFEITFRNNDGPFLISKADILTYNQERNGGRVYFDEDYFDYLVSELGVLPEDIDDLSPEMFEHLVRRYARIQGVPFQMARKRMYHLLDLKHNQTGHKKIKGDKHKVQQLSKAISDNVPERIIYLPTYRRIENDFSSLNIPNDEINNAEMLIRFGMSDVQKSIDTILGKIRALAMQGFNEMTGFLLKQYSVGDGIETKDKKIDLPIARIVLDRLGDEIEDSTKDDIILLIKNNKIYEYDHRHLLNLLNKLIANYDQQKRYDDRILAFVQTCNKYLNDKFFLYNPSNLTLEIILDNQIAHNQTVKLTQLSSGEKQIISLFSKLYLESEEKSIVIIDEPELSLSIRWQEMLLPDIMRSKNCSFLLTVTHSPFIFENEFDMDAREMRKNMLLR